MIRCQAALYAHFADIEDKTTRPHRSSPTRPGFVYASGFAACRGGLAALYTTEGSVKRLPSAKRLSLSLDASIVGGRPRIISDMTVPVTGPNMKP